MAAQFKPNEKDLREIENEVEGVTGVNVERGSKSVTEVTDLRHWEDRHGETVSHASPS